LFTDLAARGPVLVVVDQPATTGALPIAVTCAVGAEVTYLPGLAMRRIADLHPGAAKTESLRGFRRLHLVRRWGGDTSIEQLPAGAA
jgi:hypothetical protein